MIIERLSQEHLNIEKLLAILEREPRYSTAGTVLTTRSFTRLSVTSKSTQKFIIIPRKTWYLPSRGHEIRLLLRRSAI